MVVNCRSLNFYSVKQDCKELKKKKTRIQVILFGSVNGFSSELLLYSTFDDSGFSTIQVHIALAHGMFML